MEECQATALQLGFVSYLIKLAAARKFVASAIGKSYSLDATPRAHVRRELMELYSYWWSEISCVLCYCASVYKKKVQCQSYQTVDRLVYHMMRHQA